MHPAFLCLALVHAVTAAQPDLTRDRAAKHFTGTHYRVAWGRPAVLDPTAELEVGYGVAQTDTLGWLRFRPGPDGVQVLSIKLAWGFRPYDSKWPEDRAPVAVEAATLPPAAYAALLRGLAAIDAARVTPAARDLAHSSSEFWASARVTGGGRTLVDLDWAGFDSSEAEAAIARPQAAVGLAREAVGGLDFRPYTLTAADRAWASGKFARDWQAFKGSGRHIKELFQSTVLIGVVGDASALPTLRGLISGELKLERKADAGGPFAPEPLPALAHDWTAYYAINAVTRLTGKDVRSKPVEEMDVAAVRPKVLELLKAAR